MIESVISVKRLTPEYASAWDQYVMSHSESSPYHLYAWQQSVEHAYKHKIVSWCAFDNESIVGILPMIEFVTLSRSKVLVSLPYCDVGGSLADSPDIEQALFSECFGYAKAHNIATIDHRSTYFDGWLTGNENYAEAPKVRMIKALEQDAETLFASFKSKLRSQIRKAEKNQLTASLANDQRHLDGFYQVFARNMRLLGSPVHSKKWFEDVLSSYGSNAIVANIYKDDCVVGAGIVLFCGDKAAIPWASTLTAYNRLAPNMLLYWKLLSYSCERGVKAFDFGRSTLDEGTYKFKAQWGAKPTALHWQSYNREGQLISAGLNGQGKLRSLVEQSWRKLPLAVTTALGPKIRKHISL